MVCIHRYNIWQFGIQKMSGHLLDFRSPIQTCNYEYVCMYDVWTLVGHWGYLSPHSRYLDSIKILVWILSVHVSSIQTLDTYQTSGHVWWDICTVIKHLVRYLCDIWTLVPTLIKCADTSKMSNACFSFLFMWPCTFVCNYTQLPPITKKICRVSALL